MKIFCKLLIYLFIWPLFQKVKFLQSDSTLNSKNQIQAPDQLALWSVEYGHSSLRLPPSSPYDKFMKAAGC